MVMVQTKGKCDRTHHTKSCLNTPFILQSAKADFVCVDAVSTAE